MSSSGTLRPARADEAMAELLVERRLIEADMVEATRQAGGAEGSLIESLLEHRLVPLEVVELVLSDLARGVLTCPGCPGRFKVTGLPAGSRFRCKSCGTAVAVPGVIPTREILGRFGWGRTDGAPAAAAAEPTIEEADLPELPAEMADLRDDEAAPAPAPRAGADAKRAARASARDARASATPNAAFRTQFLVFVIAPVTLLVVGIFAAAPIKRWMVGVSRGDGAGEVDTVVDPGPAPTPAKPVAWVPPEKSDDWKTALQKGERGLALLGEARTLAQQGQRDAALAKFDEADGLLREALDVHAQFTEGGPQPAMDGPATKWGDEQLAARKERSGLQG